MRRRFLANDKAKFGLAFLLLLVGGGIYWHEHVDATRLAPGLREAHRPDILAHQLLSRWRKLPVIAGEMSYDLWGQPVVVAFAFDASDCGLCLARLDELIAFVDSLSNHASIGLLAIGTSRKPVLLERYLKVSPKPCPVLKDSAKVSTELYGDWSPQIIVIDRRDAIAVAKGPIGPGKVTRQFRAKLKAMLLEGW